MPGTVVTAVAGSVLFGLPRWGTCGSLAAVVPCQGAALAGLGALALGLLAPRPELATLLGQLGMSAALCCSACCRPSGCPAPSAGRGTCCPPRTGWRPWPTFDAHPDWTAVCLDLAVYGTVGVLSLAVATWAYRRSRGPLTAAGPSEGGSRQAPGGAVR